MSYKFLCGNPHKTIKPRSLNHIFPTRHRLPVRIQTFGAAETRLSRFAVRELFPVMCLMIWHSGRLRILSVFWSVLGLTSRRSLRNNHYNPIVSELLLSSLVKSLCGYPHKIFHRVKVSYSRNFQGCLMGQGL